MNGFEALRDLKEKVLKKKKWTKEQIQQCEENKKLINIWIRILFDDILLKTSEYKDAWELRKKVVDLYENLSQSQLDEEPNEEGLFAQELENSKVERSSKSKVEVGEITT